MNWIISAFNLTSCAFIPFWGQMADIFGRTATLEATILLMMLGSALCTAAPVDAFPMLILGRAIQGLSAAGIMVTIKVILADKVSLKENAKNTSIFSMFGGLSYALGPVIGGFLTDKNWRWCFGINLPVAFLGVILIFFVLRPQLLGPQPLPQLPDQETTNESAKRKERFKSRMSMIDFGGQFLFLAGIGLLILALTWGGAIYPWKSVHVITSLVLGGLLTLCFILWEYLMSPNRYLSKKFPLQNPTVPWELLSQRNIGLLFYINMATGMGTFSSVSNLNRSLLFPYQQS
jgi:MFS family permease